MSTDDKFEAWWKTLNVYNPALKALAGSAWMEAVRTSQYEPAEDPDEWVLITDMEHVLRRCDQFLNERGEWWSIDCSAGRTVRQYKTDNPRAKLRCRRRDLPKVEQKKTTDDFGMYLESVIAKDPQLKAEVDAAEAEMAAIDARLNEQAEQWPKYYTTLDSPSSDVAFVKRVDETSYSVVYKNGYECPGFLWVAKNQSRRKQLTEAEAMALLNPTSNAYFSYHEKHKPQPQKTRVRLWISAVDASVYFGESPKLRTDCEIRVDSEGFYVEGGQS